MDWVTRSKFLTVTLLISCFLSSCKNYNSYQEGWLPYIDNIPQYYWDVKDIKYGSTEDDPYAGLRKHLLFQSMSGLSHRALNEGSNNIALWDGTQGSSAYVNSEKALQDMGVKCLGSITTYELALLSAGENGTVRNVFRGYILTDLETNLESGIVATNAAHVYNAIIVDVRDKEMFDAAGFEMLYDARQKSTQDSWKEFREKCDNNALIFIHVGNAELRDMAIAYDLFVMNINKMPGTREFGSNWDIFGEVLNWLKPNAPVYGADAGNDEGEVAEIISLYGCHWVPFDWGYNTELTSLNYPARQEGLEVKNINPREIDYSLDKNFVSYYLSDGDNLQWMQNGFNPDYYPEPEKYNLKMSYGICVMNLAMSAPAQLKYFCDIQNPEVSIFERGSYYFVDQIGEKKDRNAIMKQMAREQAASMKAQNVKLLGTVTRGKVDSPQAIEGYQTLIDANDELEGIIAIAYSPYADSKQDIIWITNKKGIEIPVVMTTYCLWNKKDHNDPDEGTPAYIAQKMMNDRKKFNMISLHCWSYFRDAGVTDDLLAENADRTNADMRGIGAEILCHNRLDDSYEAVNLQEFFWRIRMEYRPEQTRKILGL